MRQQRCFTLAMLTKIVRTSYCILRSCASFFLSFNFGLLNSKAGRGVFEQAPSACFVGVVVVVGGGRQGGGRTRKQSLYAGDFYYYD